MTTKEKKQLALKYITQQKPYTENISRQKLAHFTAGIPGAGKTEIATIMKKRYKRDFGYEILHIDVDIHRENLRGTKYDSDKINSHANLLLEATIDQAVYKKLDFILDSTFAYSDYNKNLKRAFKYGYLVIISCVFAPIEKSWEYAEKRRVAIGRAVPRSYFDRCVQYSAKNVLEAKQMYKDKITVDLYIKDEDLEIHNKKYNASVEQIDNEINKFYNQASL